MVKCITCEGSGTITFTLISKGKSSSSPMNCIDCDGSGLITKEWKKKLEDHHSDWCECDDSSIPSYYVEDDEDERCLKHHYRCEACDGITQIG